MEGCDGEQGEETGRRWRGWLGVLQGRKTMEEPGGGGVRWMAGDETRPRGRRFHTVSCQKLSLTYQFGELSMN